MCGGAAATCRGAVAVCGATATVGDDAPVPYRAWARGERRRACGRDGRALSPVREWTMSLLRVTDLVKRYGSVVGVDGVSFAVEPGEIFGFLGPNGAGKTTTIRLVMQLLRPDRGAIELFATPVTRPNAALRERVGYLPGEFRPYAEMSGARFLHYMSRYRARPPKLRAELLERLHVDAATLERPIKQLSHGNRQKLGIILALEHEPDLAILDEPTLGLDPIMQEAFYDIVHMLRERGTTIFLSSHVLSEVEKICHRVAIVRAGKLVALETLESLKSKRPRRLVVVSDDDTGAILELPGATFVKRDGGRCEYLIDGAMQPVLRALAAANVVDVIFPEPDLEDVFAAYFRSEPS